MVDSAGEAVLRKRSNGPRVITKAKQDMFLSRLAMTCNVRGSCRATGIDGSGIYKLRARDAGFAARWEQALEQGYLYLEGELLRRAIGDRSLDSADETGSHEPEAMPFDPELAMKLLARRHRADAQGRRVPTRLRQPSAQEVLVALERKLTAMEKRLARRK